MNSSARIFVLALLLGFVSLPVQSHSDEMSAAMDDWPPFRISSGNGFVGLDVDLLDEIERKLGEDITFVQMPWGRGLASMQSGAVDFMSGLAYRDERAKYIAYTSPPYFQCTTSFYTPKGKGMALRSYEDLYNFEVGYVLHSAYFDRFDQDAKLTKLGVAKEQMLIDMVQHDRLDVMIGTDCQVDYFIKQQKLGELIEKATFSPGNSVDLYLGISKKSPWASRIDTVNAILKELVDGGSVKRMSWKYYGVRTADNGNKSIVE